MSRFIGWICRCWTETTDGWQYKIYHLKTEAEAEERGKEFIRGSLMQHEISREYEIYKDYTEV